MGEVEEMLRNLLGNSSPFFWVDFVLHVEWQISFCRRAQYRAPPQPLPSFLPSTSRFVPYPKKGKVKELKEEQIY